MKEKVWWLNVGFRLMAGLGAAVVMLLAVAAVSAQAAPSDRNNGSPETTFQSKCASCHTIGGGDRVGPDLKGVTAKRSRDWLVSWIVAPNQLIAQGDPTAKELVQKYSVPMPNVGISKAEAEDILKYIDAQSGGTSGGSSAASPASKPAAATTSPGDATRGKELFAGITPFQNGGSPCIACHSVGGIGALGGGALGPDLTQAYAKFGEEGIGSVLASLPFPTMSPIFSTRPLTPEEQANVKAFLQQAAVAERPVEVLGPLTAIAVAGAAALLVLLHLIWRRRLNAVRHPLVKGR